MRFANKVKVVKRRETFGEVDQKVKQAKDKVLKREVAYVNDPSKKNKILLCKSKQELDDRLQIEELYWRQKANIKWVNEGDMNTKFFHQNVSQYRSQKLCIHLIRSLQGQFLTNPIPIKEEGINYFREQLNGDHSSQGDELLLHIPRLISEC